MIYILAPSFLLALCFADKNKIHRNKWCYIHSERDLLPLQNGSEILYLNRDSKGYFDFPWSVMELIRDARDLEAMGKIKLRPVSMEQAP